MKIVIDLDGTLCNANKRDYINAEPNLEVIEKVKEYKKQGFEICIFSSRNMKFYEKNIGKINCNTIPVIIEWLNKHGVPFDEIHVGKPWCEGGFYVDDRAIRPDEFSKLSYEEIQKLIGDKK